MNHSKLNLGLYGNPDFAKRIQAHLLADGMSVSGGYLSDAWSDIITQRPDVALFDIGLAYNERTHSLLRRTLLSVRERFGQQIYILLMLSAPERAFYAGDLLFDESSSLAGPSGLIDSMLTAPPGNMPSIPNTWQQFLQALGLIQLELQRREKGLLPLPPLNSAGWAQSLADAKSRELWMRWLPRYASYTNENPLIVGATGTGKTNLAYALHLLSGRKGEFVSITPRDFSSSELVQAELFGSVSGAYTGAVDKWGLVKKAEKGTLFIDELQSIDKELQGKLITFIENKIYRRVGSAETITADVRFVFASNRSLTDMMQADVLRDDFAYRLERVQLELPALSERRLDICAALGFALAKLRRQRPQAVQVLGFSSNAYRLLCGHSWPGNLRQLENSVARLCEYCDLQEKNIVDETIVHEVFRSRLFGPAVTGQEVLTQAAFGLAQAIESDKICSLDSSVTKLKRIAIERALESSGGDYAQAAALIDEEPAVMAVLNKCTSAVKLTD